MKSLIEIAVNSMKDIMKLCIFITSAAAFGALASSPLSIDTSKFLKPSEIAAMNEQCSNSASPRSKLIAVYEIVNSTQSRGKVDQALQNSMNEGCGRIETKTFSNDELTMKITWFPELSLINSFAITEKKTDSIVESWSLKSVDLSGEQITPFFKSRYDYFATDYADIGDDHTDPFLTKMMNLGFIEHGASGFYDTNGNPMADAPNNKNRHSH